MKKISPNPHINSYRQQRIRSQSKKANNTQISIADTKGLQQIEKQLHTIRKRTPSMNIIPTNFSDVQLITPKKDQFGQQIQQQHYKQSDQFLQRYPTDISLQEQCYPIQQIQSLQPNWRLLQKYQNQGTKITQQNQQEYNNPPKMSEKVTPLKKKLNSSIKNKTNTSIVLQTNNSNSKQRIVPLPIKQQSIKGNDINNMVTPRKNIGKPPMSARIEGKKQINSVNNSLVGNEINKFNKKIEGLVQEVSKLKISENRQERIKLYLKNILQILKQD